MSKYYEAVEMCPHCDNESVYKNWNKKNGYIAKCNSCEEEIFLCDECMHAKDNHNMSCDWRRTETGGKCFRGETVNNAVVYFNVECFDRMLIIKYPLKFYDKFREMYGILKDAYEKWHTFEDIVDDEERDYIQFSCLEEFMVEELSHWFPEWIQWKSEYYGEDEKEDSPYWVTNERR